MKGAIFKFAMTDSEDEIADLKRVLRGIFNIGDISTFVYSGITAPGNRVLDQYAISAEHRHRVDSASWFFSKPLARIQLCVYVTTISDQEYSKLERIASVSLRFLGSWQVINEGQHTLLQNEFPYPVQLINQTRANILVHWGEVGMKQDEIISPYWERLLFATGYPVVGYEVNYADYWMLGAVLTKALDLDDSVMRAAMSRDDWEVLLKEREEDSQLLPPLRYRSNSRKRNRRR